MNQKDKSPLVLGIHWAHDASATLCSKNGIVYSIQEERLRRIKHYYGFPTMAIERIFQDCNITAEDIDVVAFSSESILFPEHTNSISVSKEGDAKSIKKQHPIQLKRNRKKAQEHVEKTWGEFKGRHYVNHLETLEKLGLLDERIRYYYVHHHLAHASSAFRFSGFDNACVLTMDGKGDGVSSTIYKGSATGNLELLKSSKATDSLGSFYQAITEALGFVPVDSEYKTMGLAAVYESTLEDNPFTKLHRVDRGRLVSSVEWAFRDYNQFNPSKKVPNPLSSVSQSDEFKSLLLNDSKERFAYAAQSHFEETFLQFIKDAIALTESENLAVAGGCFLNVKANLRAHEELDLDGFFIYPDSGDSGLAAGAAMEALFREGVIKRSLTLETAYLGTQYSSEDVKAELNSSPHKLRTKKVSHIDVVKELMEGKVIGSFLKRLEMGPRALGNRSVLADPRNPAIKDRINSLLKGREWFVPFAPVILDEDYSLFCKEEVDARFMTCAVHATDFAKDVTPAIVHLDGTLRPQIVTESSNSIIYELLKEFKKQTGVGVLINTSFNRHGHAIVESPKDAIEHLANGWVDALWIEGLFVEPVRTSKKTKQKVTA